MRWIFGSICVLVGSLLASLSFNHSSHIYASDGNAVGKRLDVNDVSILWPAPKTADDAKKLIAVDEKLADGINTIWPEVILQKVLATARSVSVVGSGGLKSQIKFRDRQGDRSLEFNRATNWKIAGIRVDPSAPGCSEKVIRLFGSKPQIRLVVQPVTLQGGKAIVHDVAAHLVFDFASSESLPPAAPGLPPRAQPDRMRFKAALDDLASLKAGLVTEGVKTDGDLDVHPALKANSSAFTEKIKVFLRKHLTEDRLNAVAFMGIDFPEPWIFFAMKRENGQFVQAGHPSLLPEMAQMVIFRGGDRVMPHPTNSMFGKGVGVSSAPLFEDGLDLDTAAIAGPLPPGISSVAFRDVPDIIANPQIAHFFGTDCVSCHSESTRREILGLQSLATPFQFKRPAGISGVNHNVLAKAAWNVRNFGWFPDFFNGGAAVESVAMRTGNEAAESAEFINREYFGIGAQAGPATPSTTPAVVPVQPAASLPVANALTLVMTIKSPEDRVQLKTLITKLQSLPPDKNPIAVALAKLGNVHFARFVFIGDDKLAVITTYDDDFDTYIHSFVDEIGGVFDQLLVHMKDAPPLPVEKNREKFLEYVRKNDLPCEAPFFSAYPTLRVQDILTLKKKAGN